MWDHTQIVRAVMPMLLSVQTQHCYSTNSELTQNDAPITDIPGIYRQTYSGFVNWKAGIERRRGLKK